MMMGDRRSIEFREAITPYISSDSQVASRNLSTACFISFATLADPQHAPSHCHRPSDVSTIRTDTEVETWQDKHTAQSAPALRVSALHNSATNNSKTAGWPLVCSTHNLRQASSDLGRWEFVHVRNVSTLPNHSLPSAPNCESSRTTQCSEIGAELSRESAKVPEMHGDRKRDTCDQLEEDADCSAIDQQGRRRDRRRNGQRLIVRVQGLRRPSHRQDPVNCCGPSSAAPNELGFRIFADKVVTA
ncbi:hypothetical protein SAICODRAFT_188054 [Saitoella complicata NRRL Y-17804]|uniref:uncharacterized protein n=1 Tax=Saitoella complicata (strain BCRC 22490 / CBS 7301 / JCM 7358 / NBRC 10748 / NRRL Y-17804) TaxID=698492 RepID=UPI00086768B4|nr:uncharacterized protein SAICODRAFT_188054 [Saitoella complicata NRRL Y-17804]ODQ49880.1 hypothetical protein SAICODRAFT_188054 [Saitoella complicata NRRL Y-17804]